MIYVVEIKPAALKQLKKIDKKQQSRLIGKIYGLAEDPYPASSKPLTGRDDRSMRVGNYRVLYDIYDNKLVVLVLAIGHRKEIYKK